jgi:hypothetical protein
MTRTARPTPLLLVPLLLTALLLGGCGGGSGDDDATGPAVPDGMTEVTTDVGTVARPDGWKPVDAALDENEVAAFSIENDQGQVVGQMDVIVNSVSAGTKADAVAGAIQGARMPYFPDLRHTRREFSDVPGAESAFVTESTYTTADTGQNARSLDQVAVGKDGTYLLVRISSAAKAYDPELFQQVVDTMRMSDGAAS